MAVFFCHEYPLSFFSYYDILQTNIRSILKVKNPNLVIFFDLKYISGMDSVIISLNLGLDNHGIVLPNLPFTAV
ncbi:hypothetical protein IQ37_19625 [Chryseobacterium piperi]|uniref:Uncharacterized protein n=1 Tax=Chryseobacterium piperi TaxID=558152 RepID=A0A086A1X7_9FLAO|nr:hypothetical protein CJF12_03710 [Chryseobacterium piperi]KFF10691.1 hypothetical protein IQ37_19625 [Chryseobacterium piperi]